MTLPKVFVTRSIPDAGLELLRDRCSFFVWPEDLPPPREVLLEKAAGCDGLLTLLTDRIDAEVMDRAGPRLKVISNMAVGYDNVDVLEARLRGIRVGNTPGVLTETTADLAFSLMAAAARRLAEGVDYIRAGKWRTWGPKTLLGWDLHGATLGIVGFGRIGRAMARRATGFGMRILFVDPAAHEEEAAALGATRVGSLGELLEQSDFVTLHAPMTDETRHLIGEAEFSSMKRSAILVNTARGAMVDPDALYLALRDRVIAYAALDVTDPEPLPSDHRLLTLPNCLVVPHIGSASHATRNRMAVMAAENLLAGLRGENLPNEVR
jgi:glyoxylate reductase